VHDVAGQRHATISATSRRYSTRTSTSMASSTTGSKGLNSSSPMARMPRDNDSARPDTPSCENSWSRSSSVVNP